MQLQQAQLEKRSKELDAREAYLDEKLKLLEEAPITLKSYDAQIEMRGRQIISKSNEIANADKRIADLESDIAIKENMVKHLNETIDSLNKKHDELEKDGAAEVNKLRAMVRPIENEIDERRKYLNEQERTITDAVAIGNDKLLSTQDQISTLQRVIDGHEINRAKLKSEIDSLVIRIDSLNNDLLLKQAEYEAVIIHYEQQKLDLQHDIQESSKQKRSIDHDIDLKLAILREKEASLSAKREELRIDRQELELDKRRWNSTKSLYNET